MQHVWKVRILKVLFFSYFLHYFPTRPAKVLLIALLACSSFWQASARCRFSLGGPDWYICNLENVRATSTSDIIDLSGDHIGGRSNADVKEVTVASSSSFLEEIPSNIFDTFPNIVDFILESNVLRRIELTNCGSQLRTLRFSGNQIPTLQNGAFRGCRSVDVLQLTACGITRIDENAFADLPDLRELTAIDNFVQEIQENLFRSQTKLELLLMHVNRISTVHPRAFQTLVSLTQINLMLNALSTVVSGLFTNMPNLAIINLRFNVQTIEAGAFGNLPNLQILDISQGNHRVVNANFFGTTLPRLLTLWLDGSGVFAFDRNVFNQLPNLNTMFMNGNNCQAPTSFVLFNSVEDEVLPFMQNCLRNFEEL